MRLLILLAASAVLEASSPKAWEMTSFQDFVRGSFSSLALHRDGRVTLGPKLESLLTTEEAAVWSLAAAPDGTVYAGTGHKGKLYRVDRAGKAEAIFTSPEAEIFAAAVDAAGTVYAGTSPNGKIYRIAGGKATEYFAPGSKYIWSLAIGKDGALYAGTGDDGKVWRIVAGKGEPFYETGQVHVTALAVDASGAVVAGTEPNGILYRISARDKAFVVYDANLPEIRSIAVATDGSLYVGAMGGAVARQSASPGGSTPAVSSTVTVTGTATSITVTDQSAQQGEIKPKPAEATPAAPAAATPAAAIYEQAGVEKSAIYKVHPDNTVETLWSSKDENAYDLVLNAGGVYFSTDNQGRIYHLDNERRIALIAETRDSEVVRLLGTPVGTLAASSTPGKLYRLSAPASAAGFFESPIHDATTAARWGKLSWRGEPCAGCQVVFRTRSGNSARPDKTWSEWSAEMGEGAGAAIASPNARYVQWKAEFQGSGGKGPSLDSVRLAYLPQNTPPTVRSITVSAQTAAAAVKAANAGSAAATYSITVTDSGDTGATSATGTATQPVTRASNEQIVITWVGEDLDGDKLTYDVHFRGEGESVWKPLKTSMSESLTLLDAEALADGRYFFRVTASDRMANPAAYARVGELISSPVLVDRTPPMVRAAAPSRSGNAVEVKVEATDGASPLKACEYSVNAGPWTPVAPDDGVVDSERETFTIRLDAPAGTELLLVIRAYDAANNSGLAKTVLR